MTDHHVTEIAGRVPERLPLLARVADALSMVLVVVAVFVIGRGGVVLRIAAVRIAVRSEWRVLAWAALLLVVRHLLVRRNALPRRLITGARSIRAAHGPLVNDAALLAGADAVRTDMRWTRRRVLAYAAGVLLLFTALTTVMTYPQVRVLDRGVTQDFGDPLLSTWRLAWVAHQLPRDPLHLFDANIFYPERFTLAFSDAMLVPSLTVAPLLWLGVPQLLAYNLALLSAFVLSGAAMFLLVRSLTGRAGAALVAGFVFAFLPYRFMHYAHLELQMAQWMPLCLWALHRTVTTARVRDGVLTGLFIALQTLSSFYYGIFFVTYLVPVGLAVWLGASAELRRRSIRPLAAGAVVAAVLIIPFTLPYFAARRSVGERPVWEIEFYSATPKNYLAAHPRNALLGTVTAKWGGQERELFEGLVVPALAVAALWPPLSAARIGYAAGLAIAFDVSLGFNGFSYPWLHEYAFPYRGLRVPARMAILVGLSLAILVGYAVARVEARLRGRRAAIAVLGMLALVYIEYRSTLVLDNVWTEPPPVYAALPPDPKTVVLELPLIQPDIALEPIYMYFSTFGWHNLVNGYSGFEPDSYVQLHDRLATFPDATSVSELRRRQVEFVIVHGAFYSALNYQRVVSRLDADEAFELVTRTRWRDRETRLYRLRGRTSGEAN